MPTTKKKPVVKKTDVKKKTVPAAPAPASTKDKPIGKVSHYYDKIGVAIVDLKATLKKGDLVKIVRGDQAFEQMIQSMQLEHQEIAQAPKGKSIGVKVDQKVKEGALVFKA